MTKEERLKYWQNRGGQIEWRIHEWSKSLQEARRDLQECDENIRKLKAEINSVKGIRKDGE